MQDQPLGIKSLSSPHSVTHIISEEAHVLSTSLSCIDLNLQNQSQ